MLRFYFHVFDDDLTEDYEGQFAVDLSGAEEIARKSARELICEQVRKGYLNLNNYIVIADQAGLELSRIVFSEAFEFHDGSCVTDTSSGYGGKPGD